jgi:sec-independent protein translocase protein TatB
MFEVGFTEIVLILGLALLVLGPERLPGLAQKVGRWTGRARAMARQLRTQLEHEVTMEELAKSRPMQSSAAEPPATSPTPSSTAGDVPPHAGPELDLDTTVAGAEPPAGTPAQDAAEGAAAKAPQ